MTELTEEAWLAQADNRYVLTPDHECYPPLLREISDAPLKLYAMGAIEHLLLPQFAVVGTRNPTPQGRQTTYDFAKALAKTGLSICSGLAMGIDAKAHEGALGAGGVTVAVLGNGLDSVYPAKNRTLAHRIVDNGGVILSEFPLGTPPLPRNFPIRNRIVTGMSVGTLVTEAALGSGSLISARLASEQGREVFAIPGSIHNTVARGCHRLIRQGAKLVESLDDLVDDIQPLVSHALSQIDLQLSDDTPEVSDEVQQVLDALGFEPIQLDLLLNNIQLDRADAQEILMDLEMDGRIQSMSGQRVQRLK